MISKAKIKHIRLLKQKKFRDQFGQFIVEGYNNTKDFLNSDLELIDLFVTNIAAEYPEFSSPVSGFESISEKEMSQISALKNPSDILAVFRIPKPSRLPETRNEFILALDNIQDPGNLGTIIRTADWFGINNILCSSSTVDAYNPKVVQATMGSLSRVSLHYLNLPDAIKKLSLPVYGAVLNGTRLNEVSSPQPGIILIGSEAHGISSDLRKEITKKITIPLLKSESDSQPESLNASVACAIICYALKIST